MGYISYEDFAWVLAGLAIVFGLTWFFLIRVTMDPKVERLARIAFDFAATALDMKATGSVPPVVLVSQPWKKGSLTITGNYKWYSIPFIHIVLWDRIIVVNNIAYIFAVLVHEMVHAVRRRNGLPSEHIDTTRIQALARDHSSAEIDALLEKL